MAVQKILVVDDDAELRKMMAHFLSNNGFMVYTASTGAEIENFINKALEVYLDKLQLIKRYNQARQNLMMED